jgi:large subunit ribosomal protein L20
MPRVTKALTARSKHKKVLKATKGHYGARSRLFRTAKQSNVKALQYAFRDRRNKKRTFRSLWISRISAALMPLEVSYSRFINQLSKANIKLDRKIFSWDCIF